MKIKIFLIFLILFSHPVLGDSTFFDDGDDSFTMGSIASSDSSSAGNSGHQLSNIVPSAPSSERRAPSRPSRRSPAPKESALFDVIGKIIEKDETLEKGAKEVSFEVDLLKFGLIDETTNAQVIYSIFDNSGNLIHTETENIGVETKMNFIKTLTLSEELIEGEYNVKIDVLYDGKTAESEMSFEVVEEILKEKSYLFYYLLLSVFLILGMVVVLKKYLKQRKKLEKKEYYVDSFNAVEQKSVSWIRPLVKDKINPFLKLLILKLLDSIELIVLFIGCIYKKIKLKWNEEKDFLKKVFRGDLWK